MTWTPDTLNVKDASGTSQPVIAYTDGTNYAFAHPILDATGAVISPATAGKQDEIITAVEAIQVSVAAATPAGSNSIGQVTANAGTNLNTSALALESGGNLATVAAAQGTSGSGITQPSGGAGILGWLSGIFNKLNTSVAVTGTFWQATQPVSGTVTANAGTGTMAVSAASLPLPADAATATLQSTSNTALSTIATNTTGGATSARQDTANTALAAIQTSVGNIPASPATAALQSTGNTSVGNVDTNLGAQADSAAASDTGTFSLIALFKRSLQTLTTLSGAVATTARQDTGNTTLASLLAESNRPLIVTGGTTTRPSDTTAYAAGDLVANSTTAGSVTYPTIAAARANDQVGTILRLRLKKSGAVLTNGIFRVHLYNSQPTVTNGDNGVWLTTTSGYVGSFDVTMTQAFSDSSMGIGVPSSGSGVAFTPATGTQNLYYLIEARGAYTPASAEVFTPYVEVQ